jgi:predicted lysophospholipase L1 biosynthesis ABC-type transport system permease subunit
VRSGPDSESAWLEIIGVVGDIRRDSRSLPPVPELYYHLTQDVSRQPSYSVKIEGPAQPVLAQIRAALRRLDPEIPMGAVASLESVIGRTVQRPRAIAFVLVGFGALALVVAAVGIYGVISFLVTERHREIAVRLAIGASAGRVLLETTGQGLRPTLVGLGLGLGVSVLLGSAVSGFLYEVTARDPITYTAVVATIMVTGAVGALVPSLRASRVAPATVLRE